nr:MAG TPA: hypothetical protein [Microviridae sp.]
MNKELIKLICKILLYIITALASYFGVVSLTSCSTSRDVVVKGRAVIVTNDTTIIDHGRVFNYNYSYRK